MAVVFEVEPSAEVETKVDSVDLANGDSIVDQQQSEPTESQESTPAEENSEAPEIDPELIRKWEQDCNEATKQHAISIEQTRNLIVDLEKQISQRTIELKSIKSEEKLAVERLIRLETRGPELPPKPQAKKVSGSGATTASDSTDEGVEYEDTEDTDDSTDDVADTLADV